MTIMVGDILQQIGDDSGVHWKTDEINKAIQEGWDTWQAMTGSNQISYNVYVPNGNVSPYFLMPTQVMAPLQVSYTSWEFVGASLVPVQVANVLTPISIEELDNWIPQWEDPPTGTPVYWCPIGMTNIAVYPIPTYSGTVPPPYLSVQGVTSFSTPDLYGEDDPILDYMLHLLTFKEGGQEFQTSVTGLKALVGAAGLKNGRLKKTAFYRREMGLQRDEVENISRVGGDSLGVRGGQK